jgi:hypothetical protein
MMNDAASTNPAALSSAFLAAWHDVADGFNYTLDRRLGDLRVAAALSTGGYFLHERCGLEN